MNTITKEATVLLANASTLSHQLCQLQLQNVPQVNGPVVNRWQAVVSNGSQHFAGVGASRLRAVESALCQERVASQGWG